jgi:hypothetical protein
MAGLGLGFRLDSGAGEGGELTKTAGDQDGSVQLGRTRMEKLDAVGDPNTSSLTSAPMSTRTRMTKFQYEYFQNYFYYFLSKFSLFFKNI